MLECFQCFYFLTFINFFLVLIAPLIYKYIDLFFLSIVVCVIGLYVSHISPGYVSVLYKGEQYVLKTGCKVFLDLLFHILPVIYIFIRYQDYYKDNANIFTALLVILVYVSIMDIDYLYNTNIDVAGLLLIICIVGYCAIQNIL